MALNSRITSWTKYLNNMALIVFFLHLTTLKATGKLETFHKFLKPTLKKLCKKNPSNWDKYINHSSHKLQNNTQPCHSWKTIFPHLWQRPKTCHYTNLLSPLQRFLGDTESGLLNLEAHHLALAIAKKTLDENHFRTAEKTTDKEPPSFKIGDRVYCKKQTTKQVGSQMETGIQDCPVLNMQWMLPTQWKSSYWKNKTMQCQRCSTWTTSGTLEHWYTVWQSWKIH